MLGSDVTGCYQPDTMLRRFGIKLVWLWPAVMLAVLLQIMLPFAMFRTQTTEADLLDLHRVICGTASTDDASNDAPPHGPGQRSHHCLCPVCHLGSSKPVVLLAGTVVVPMPSLVSDLVLFDPAQSVGPRGPPTGRPRARSPPSLG